MSSDSLIEDLSYLQSPGQVTSDVPEVLSMEDIPLSSTRLAPTIREVSDYGDECFVLSNLMSLDECSELIQKGEKIGFGDIRTKSAYRNSTRLVFKSDALAAELWSRVKTFLNPLSILGDPHDVHIHGVESLLHGVWKPHNLNPMFRFCKYDSGGHFAPHFDGHYTESSTVRSLKTLMIYLNDDFEGGSTNFVDPKQELHQASDGRYCAEETNILCSVVPEPGLALVFNHHRLHEGQQITNGVKYILRTDIMFMKEASEGTGMRAEDEKALLMVQEAERLESLGENMAAMELYRKAFKLSSHIAKAFGN